MFKLSLVTIDIRRKINEVVKDNKVNSKNGSIIDTRVKDNSHKTHKEKSKDKENRGKRKKYITISGVKYDGDKIQVEANKSENVSSEDVVGVFIDKIK